MPLENIVTMHGNFIPSEPRVYSTVTAGTARIWSGGGRLYLAPRRRRVWKVIAVRKMSLSSMSPSREVTKGQGQACYNRRINIGNTKGAIVAEYPYARASLMPARPLQGARLFQACGTIGLW